MPVPAVPLRVAVVGLGTIGRTVAAAVVGDPTTTLAGLVDVEFAVGQALRQEFGRSVEPDIAVGDDPDVLRNVDVAIMCASPRLDRIAPTLRRLLRKRIPVVAACAEMTWPWLRHPHLADVLAAEARAAGVAVLGGDVYPGFGWSPELAMSQIGVRRVSVRRSAVLTPQRSSVLRRCGLGKTVTQFTLLARRNLVGQPGLGESAVVVAQNLGRHPTRSQIAITVLPLVAETAIDSTFGRFDAGHVIGVRQRAAFQDDEVDIELELTMAQPRAESTTEWTFEGASPLREAMTDDTRVPAATGVLMAAARRMRELAPGLRTMLDLSALPANERRP